jgi:hypothetical protein
MKEGSYEILLTGENPSVVPGAALVGALRNYVGPEGANDLLKRLEELQTMVN